MFSKKNLISFILISSILVISISSLAASTEAEKAESMIIDIQNYSSTLQEIVTEGLAVEIDNLRTNMDTTISALKTHQNEWVANNIYDSKVRYYEALANGVIKISENFNEILSYESSINQACDSLTLTINSLSEQLEGEKGAYDRKITSLDRDSKNIDKALAGFAALYKDYLIHDIALPQEVNHRVKSMKMDLVTLQAQRKIADHAQKLYAKSSGTLKKYKDILQGYQQQYQLVFQSASSHQIILAESVSLHKQSLSTMRISNQLQGLHNNLKKITESLAFINDEIDIFSFMPNESDSLTTDQLEPYKANFDGIEILKKYVSENDG